MLSEQLTRPVVDVRIEHPAADEWEVHLAGGGASVGYVTRLGSVYESIDVLPPYEVRLSGSLEGALESIYVTLTPENGRLLEAYGR
ncbi:hypothetical protein [Herbiconiux sp.]|uniref:hypothetical protein n=1 Tax=Herbiconiux sp. TaxID=1871186 RepID=UPI0025B7D1B2|nr:hypothetical protein [Herbiconiux sp.]